MNRKSKQLARSAPARFIEKAEQTRRNSYDRKADKELAAFDVLQCPNCGHIVDAEDDQDGRCRCGISLSTYRFIQAIDMEAVTQVE